MGVVLAGTGHRPDKLGGYDFYHDRGLARLTDLAIACFEKLRPSVVISGAALGWDTAIALAAIEMQIELWCAIPFEGQESKWSKQDRDLHEWITYSAKHLWVVDEVQGYRLNLPPGYHPQKMNKRNELMVDNCELVLALWNGEKGGTANCVEYAKRKGREIINAWKSWDKHKDSQAQSRCPSTPNSGRAAITGCWETE